MNLNPVSGSEGTGGGGKGSPESWEWKWRIHNWSHRGQPLPRAVAGARAKEVQYRHLLNRTLYGTLRQGFSACQMLPPPRGTFFDRLCCEYEWSVLYRRRAYYHSLAFAGRSL
ncbi:hypothetical protein VTK56DRAFT_2750 [Thermocarpiscus australiensis]